VGLKSLKLQHARKALSAAQSAHRYKPGGQNYLLHATPIIHANEKLQPFMPENNM